MSFDPVYVGAEDESLDFTAGVVGRISGDTAFTRANSVPVVPENAFLRTKPFSAKLTSACWLGWTGRPAANGFGQLAAGWYVVLEDRAATGQTVCGIRYLSGQSIHTFELAYVDAAGVVTSIPGTSFQVDTTGGPYHRFNLEYVRHASAGRLAVYLGDGGLQLAAFEGATDWRSAAGATGIDRASVRGGRNDVNSMGNWTEVIACDQSTIGHRVAVKSPSGAGFHTGFTSGDHTSVNEAAADARATLSSAAGGQRESFTMTDLSATAKTMEIVGVYPTVWAKRGSAGPQNLKFFHRAGGTDHDGANLGPGLVFARGQEKLLVNPATGAEWTHAELTAREPGLLSVT